MLKATKNYNKKLMDAEELRKSYIRDMKAEGKLDTRVDTSAKHRKEFGEFLEFKVNHCKYNEFFHAMYAKVVQGSILTENMVNALRKCMVRDSDFKQEKSHEKGSKQITLKLRAFLMKNLKLDSRIITGTVKAESAKAWLIEGHADMLENMSYCVRCGRELTEPASQVTGMGATCADKVGIPYDPTSVLGASKAERKRIREQYVAKLHNQKFEQWIPKGHVEVLEG